MLNSCKSHHFRSYIRSKSALLHCSFLSLPLPLPRSLSLGLFLRSTTLFVCQTVRTNFGPFHYLFLCECVPCCWSFFSLLIYFDARFIRLPQCAQSKNIPESIGTRHIFPVLVVVVVVVALFFSRLSFPLTRLLYNSISFVHSFCMCSVLFTLWMKTGNSSILNFVVLCFLFDYCSHYFVLVCVFFVFFRFCLFLFFSRFLGLRLLPYCIYIIYLRYVESRTRSTKRTQIVHQANSTKKTQTHTQTRTRDTLEWKETRRESNRENCRPEGK